MRNLPVLTVDVSTLSDNDTRLNGSSSGSGSGGKSEFPEESPPLEDDGNGSASSSSFTSGWESRIL